MSRLLENINDVHIPVVNYFGLRGYVLTIFFGCGSLPLRVWETEIVRREPVYSKNRGGLRDPVLRHSNAFLFSLSS